MRYTVTFEVYIQGDSDKHALSKAELIARNQNAIHPNQDWAVAQLHQTPFASLMSKEVDINELKYGKNEPLPF